MTTPAPIKRHPAIVSFSKDHHFGLLLIWKIRQGLTRSISVERISNYILYFFKEDLASHFREEEELLFSKLSSEDPLRQRAETDHLLIYSLIRDIESNKSDEVLLNLFATELEKHIRFEERDLFNHIQEVLGVEALLEISRRFSGSKHDIDEKWQDNFWEIKK
ncbi:MAG: hemerythrin domain-containing protein [Sphingobacteriia bacterium]|nr:hemerythrin domain-containing protein [Sphingobacteriia bacterium]